MGDDVNNNFTEGQKNAIYKEMLVPLKLKISQILLYDTEAALEFLQQYNEIVKNEDALGNQIIEKIVELEFKIQNYMSKTGKEKTFKERSKAILQGIDDLRTNSIQLSLEDFENEFSKIKRDYEENIENYSFEDREKIEREIYALQASLIMKQVTSGKTADELQQTITEQDKVGLNIFVAEQINTLKQKDGLKDIATKVNNIVMTDSNAVLNPKLWSWLNAAERGIKRDEQSQMIQPVNSTAMIAVPKKKSNTFKNWISRLFSKEPVFPLQISDLKKINIEWLSKYIPEFMLVEFENRKLEEEQRQVDERYVPNPKAIIHSMFYEEIRADKEQTLTRETSERKVYDHIKEYPLFLKNNAIITISIARKNTYFADSGNFWYSSYYISATSGSNNKTVSCDSRIKSLITSLRLAELLDKIFNTDFQQQILSEVKDVYIDGVSEKTPVHSNLEKSWDNMILEYEQTRIEFDATEEAKRKQFYEKNSFKEQLKQQSTRDGVEEELEDENEIITQHVEHNDDGQEQGGK